MEKNKVNVYHTKATSWYNDVDYYIKGIFEKYSDTLIDWKLATNKNGEFIIWYVVKNTDSAPDEKQIKI